MSQKYSPHNEPKRMTRDELSRRLHDLQATSENKNHHGKLRESELQAVLHELEVYQIELEMQNRELHDSRFELEQSHERYVNLYDYAPTGYLTLDERATMKEVNLTLCGMLGIERSWLIDRSLAPWVLPSDLSVFRDHMKKCQNIGDASNEKIISTVQLVRKDKQVITVELISVSTTNPGEKIKSIKTTVLDITKKKELESELYSSLETLKKERKLRELFVSTLTHDLRTPLASAMLSAQLIIRNSKPSDQNIFLANQIFENTNRMDIMIQNLLDANRIRAGEKITLNKEECDLSVLTRNTIDILKSIHGDRFKLISPKSFPCFLDPMGLRRIIENLCNNAVKYGSPSTSIVVTIEQLNRKIQLSVYNEGPVISKKDQTMLFNQFQRTDSAETGGKKGWGIGLTLIRGLVEGHGGTVRVESEIGKGTSFIIELPIERKSP